LKRNRYAYTGTIESITQKNSTNMMKISNEPRQENVFDIGIHNEGKTIIGIKLSQTTKVKTLN